MADSNKILLCKVALVTGASSGIGATTAIEFASNGCSLALVALKEKDLKVTSEKCQDVGLQKEKILIIEADLTKENVAQYVIKKTTDLFGRLDILVNSAGILRWGDVLECKLEEYDEIMNINMRAILVLCKVAIPYLIESKGNIVNVSSVGGSRPYANILPYCISKAALNQFTCCTALDLGSRGVRVNAVNPGVIVEEYENVNFLEKSKAAHALGPVGTAKEVAQLILFLASDKASFITGQCVAIDGGIMLMSAM